MQTRVTAAVVLAMVAAGLSLLTPGGTASAGTPLPGAPDCPVFPADNVWNTDISGLPVEAHSAAWMASMHSATTNLHPDFGPSGDPANPYGMPYTVVSPSHALVTPTFLYGIGERPGSLSVRDGHPHRGWAPGRR